MKAIQKTFNKNDNNGSSSYNNSTMPNKTLNYRFHTYQ